jgi:LacI family transcriptional regulator
VRVVKTPTYSQIAAACGVSSSTVSRALNNHRSIPEATRNRIRSIARKMGWQPNPLASAYMAHLRSTHPPSFKAALGVAVDYPMPTGLEDLPSHIRRICHGIEERARESGYVVQVFSLQDPDMTPALLDRTMFNRNIPGFAITGLSEPGKVLEGINWSRYASVAMGFSMPSPSLHRVATNVSHGFKLVIDKAFELGYRRLGVAVAQDYDRRTNHGVLFPLSYTQQRLGAGQSLESLVYEGSGPEVIPVIARWLEAYRPDIVVGTWVADAIASLGWRVPEDVALLTFDRSPEYPNHAGLDQRYEATGRLAADVLISEITHNRRGIPADPVEHTVRGVWVDGPSAPRKTS